MQLRKFTSSGPGLRSAAPSPSLRAACPPALSGLAFGHYGLILGGAQVGGPVASKAPRTVFHAFLPCSVQRSKKHPQSRVNSASLAAQLPLLSVPLFLLSRVSKSCPEGGQHGSGTYPVGAGGGGGVAGGE